MSKKTFDVAKSKDKKLIIQLKENQKELLQNCNDIIRFCTVNDIHQSTGEKTRNRIEVRNVSKELHENNLQYHNLYSYQ